MADPPVLPAPKVLRVSELQMHSGPVAESYANGVGAASTPTPLSQSIGPALIGTPKGRAWDWAVLVCTAAVAASVILGSTELGLTKGSASTPIVIEFESAR
jgi:hypothetical protein